METTTVLFEVQREYHAGPVGERIWIWTAYGPGYKDLPTAQRVLAETGTRTDKWTRAWRIAKVKTVVTTEVVE